MRRTVSELLLRVVAAAVVLLAGLPASAAAADESGREQAMRDALASTGVYVDHAVAGGEADLWRDRLAKAVRRSKAPVQVALWAEVPRVWPTMRRYDEAAPDRVAKVMNAGSARILLETWGAVARPPEDASLDDTLRTRALADQADAVARELVKASGDSDRYREVLPVTWAWVWLRLSAQDRPDGHALVDELSGDTSLLVDTAWAPEHPVGGGYDPDDPFFSPVSAAIAVMVVLGTIAFFLWRWRRTRRPEEGPDRSPLVTSLTDQQIEERVTALSVAIADGRVRPGETAYDRAQACLDAAGHWVDVETDRARVGCHLLTEDGFAALEGKEPPKRCYFNPEHRASTSLRRDDVVVPCCAACRGAVRAGKRPDALMVADRRGIVAPYLEVDDVWSRTGYGAIDHSFAKRVLLAALEDGAR